MERKEWKFDLDGSEHSVVLDWTYYSGERRVSLDGQVVNENAVAMRWKSEQEFKIAGHQAVVRTRPRRKVSPYFVISLEVDGKEVDATSPLTSRWERSAA